MKLEFKNPSERIEFLSLIAEAIAFKERQENKCKFYEMTNLKTSPIICPGCGKRFGYLTWNQVDFICLECFNYLKEENPDET